MAFDTTEVNFNKILCGTESYYSAIPYLTACEFIHFGQLLEGYNWLQ